jgi:hypothetical protein
MFLERLFKIKKVVWGLIVVFIYAVEVVWGLVAGILKGWGRFVRRLCTSGRR